MKAVVSPYVAPGIYRPKANSQEVVSMVKLIVCDYFGVKYDDIVLKTRRREIVLARQFAMCIISDCTLLSLKSIGKHFGGKDHSTVIHAKNVIKNLISIYPDFKLTLDAIYKKLHNENIYKIIPYEKQRAITG